MNITNKMLEELSYDLEIDETEGMMARVYEDGFRKNGDRLLVKGIPGYRTRVYADGRIERIKDQDVVEDIIELTKDMILDGEEFGEVEATRPTAKELGLALVRANREARR